MIDKLKKAQMGNMLHLVIIGVVILIAAMAIILLTTKTVNKVGDDSENNMEKSNDVIKNARDMLLSCPGSCSDKNNKLKENGEYYCCERTTYLESRCEQISNCN